jgi:hypothetical protein
MFSFNSNAVRMGKIRNFVTNFKKCCCCKLSPKFRIAKSVSSFIESIHYLFNKYFVCKFKYISVEEKFAKFRQQFAKFRESTKFCEIPPYRDIINMRDAHQQWRGKGTGVGRPGQRRLVLAGKSSHAWPHSKSYTIVKWYNIIAKFPCIKSRPFCKSYLHNGRPRYSLTLYNIQYRGSRFLDFLDFRSLTTEFGLA